MEPTRDAAWPCQPVLAPLARHRVDPVGLRLRGVVLPHLDPGVRVVPPLVQETQRHWGN